MNSNDIASTETSVGEEVRAKEAHQAVKRELAALSAEQVVQVNLDIHHATANAIAVRARLEALRQALHDHFRKYNSRGIDKLEVYAHALLHADSVLQQQKKSLTHDALRWATDEANDRKQVLLADCRSLVDRRLISASVLDDYSGLHGYKNTASDLELLCTVLSTHWEHIEGRCATTRTELERARRLALRMVRLLAKREQLFARIAKAADNRARAFTLFVNCYDELRRAVTFVRWHEGDADEIAPSLHAVRRRHEQERRGIQ